MKVSVETLPSSEAVLNVDFSWEELETASNKAYRKLVQKVDIQGFRRGKAPRSILERKLGKEYIYQEGLDELITDTYRGALKEHNIVPLTQPELDAPMLELGQPYHFSIKVPILPTVELGDYKSLHFERPQVEITSEEVENELEALRQRQAQWEEVDRAAEITDRVTMELKLTCEEQTISDLKNNTFELTDQRHGLFTGMDEQIVGMQKGESKTFSTVVPEDYTNEKLAGKTADYEVTLQKVEVKNAPELDDAFAQKVSNNEYQNLEDLRKAMSDQLLDGKKRKAREELREQVIKAVVDQASMTIHPVLIEEEAHEMMHQMSHVLEQQHMSLDQYLMLVKKSQQEYEESLKPDAEWRVKQQLVFAEVGKKEEIKVSVEEIEQLFNLYAQMGQPLPKTEEQVRGIANSMQREKTITRLLELTTDPDPDEAKEEAGEETGMGIEQEVVAEVQEGTATEVEEVVVAEVEEVEKTDE